MRILILNDFGTPSGGAEIIMFTLRDRLRDLGHDARLLTTRARPVPIPVQADYTCFGRRGTSGAVLQALNPWARREVRNVLRSFRPDVVHLKMFLTALSPLVLAPLRGTPTLWHIGNYQLTCPLNTKLLPDGSACHHDAGSICRSLGCVSAAGLTRFRVQQELWRRGQDAIGMSVAVSAWVMDRLRADGVAVDEVVWNGVPVSPRRAPLSGAPTVGFVGRLFAKKGVDVLLRALPSVIDRVPDAQLVVVGEGPERSDLETLASTLGLRDRVRFTGYLPRAAAEETLASAWVQAVTSVWEEPFGAVTAEAMMRGTAVVGTAIGGTTEMVRNGRTGLLVPPGDATALAAALATVLGDRELAERFGDAGRAVALAELTEDRMVDAFVGLYQRLLGTAGVSTGAAT